MIVDNQRWLVGILNLVHGSEPREVGDGTKWVPWRSRGYAEGRENKTAAL